jgi:excisionase family DNA binding protein
VDVATISVSEAARVLRISRNLAYELVARGEIPALRLGRRIVIPRAQLDRLLAGPPAGGAGTTEAVR